MENCNVTWETLTEYADGRLSPADQPIMEMHLAAGCAACRERLAWLADAAAALNPATFETPPAHTLSAAHNLFREKRRKPSLITQIARQIFDSRIQTPQLAGARGTNEGTFRLLYQVDNIEIELYGEVVETQNFYLIGQARSSETALALTPAVALLNAEGASGAETHIAATIEGNEFHFAEIPEGRYVLILWLSDVGLSVTDIRIGG